MGGGGVYELCKADGFIHHHLLEGLAETATGHVTLPMTSNVEDDRSLSAEESHGKMGEGKKSSRVSEKDRPKRKAEDGQKCEEDGSDAVNVSDSADIPRKKPSLAVVTAEGGNSIDIA